LQINIIFIYYLILVLKY